MGRKRRRVGVEQTDRWVFNRIAAVYDARPPYPQELIEAVVALAPGPRVLDLGAGAGHFALPLAARGLDVVALEPAEDMLESLQRAALTRGIALRAVHAAAERIPFEPARFDLVLVADALHFLDSELVGREIARVLAPGGRLCVVACEFADTPFMNAVQRLVDVSAQRRPRRLDQALRQLAALARVDLRSVRQFYDQTPVDSATLERILGSVSFVGPAMNAERAATFRERLHALPFASVWARRFTLHEGRRRRTAWVAAP